MNKTQEEVIKINKYWISMQASILPEMEGLHKEMLKNEIKELQKLLEVV